jgi:hypothetical protein
MKSNLGWPIIGRTNKWKNLFQNAPILALATAQGLRLAEPRLRLAGPGRRIGAQGAPGETNLAGLVVAL